MNCNNIFSGKHWAVFDSKLSGPPGDPDYRGTTLLHENVPEILHSVNVSLRLELGNLEN
jgi:hypothetical protein